MERIVIITCCVLMGLVFIMDIYSFISTIKTDREFRKSLKKWIEDDNER